MLSDRAGDRFWQPIGEDGRYGWDRALIRHEQARLPNRVEELEDYLRTANSRVRSSVIAGGALTVGMVAEMSLGAPIEVIVGTAAGAMATLGYGLLKIIVAQPALQEFSNSKKEIEWLNTGFPVAHGPLSEGGQRNHS